MLVRCVVSLFAAFSSQTNAIDDPLFITESGSRNFSANILLLALGGSSWPSLFYSVNHDFIVVYVKGFQKKLGDRSEFA